MYDQLCRYLYARAMSCVHVDRGSYGRVQTAPKVRVCAAVLRETCLLHACPRVQKFTPRNTATTTVLDLQRLQS